jgi:hypothetical protein
MSIRSRLSCFRCVIFRHSCLPLRHFGHVLFLKGLESHGSGVSCFRWLTLRHFGGLKIRYLKCPETLGSRLCDHRLAILDFMMPWKCMSCRVVRPWAQGYKASTGNLYSILMFWRPQNAITRVSRDHRPKGILHRQSVCSAFWWPENEILQGNWGPCLKNKCFPLSNFRHFSGLKIDSCSVVKSSTPGQLA